MTTPSEETTDDRFWRRPDPSEAGDGAGPPAGAGDGPAAASPGPGAPGAPPGAGPELVGAPAPPSGGYTGPPATMPPPPGWRPPLVLQPPPPRPLPPQDAAAIDAEEQNARTVTYGVGLIAGAVLVVLVCLLCSRALF